MPKPKKKHLILDRDEQRSLCGRIISRSACTTMADFKDWGFDGDIKDLCDRCQEKFDLECNIFTNASRQVAEASRDRVNLELTK